MRAAEPTNAGVCRRYQRLAPIYERANLEPLLYSGARTRAIELLDLRPGMKVLDLACGTGVNFTRIEQHIGRTGSLVGLDLTPAMLARARDRARSHGWRNVRLYESDASQLSAQRLEALCALESGGRFDAALCTLALSVIPDWQRAWAAVLSVVRPGGRVAVMDAGHPDTRGGGRSIAARPVAWALGRVFAANNDRRPWELVVRDTRNPVLERFSWGYVSVAAGDVHAGLPPS